LVSGQLSIILSRKCRLRWDLCTEILACLLHFCMMTLPAGKNFLCKISFPCLNFGIDLSMSTTKRDLYLCYMVSSLVGRSVVACINCITQPHYMTTCIRLALYNLDICPILHQILYDSDVQLLYAMSMYFKLHQTCISGIQLHHIDAREYGRKWRSKCKFVSTRYAKRPRIEILGWKVKV